MIGPQGVVVRPPVLPPQPPPPQVLQVQVPAGQQVMQVRAQTAQVAQLI